MGRIEYVVCPFCMHNLPVKHPVHGIRRYDIFDIDNDFFIQVRVGGGKKAGTGAKGRGKAPGSGFHLVEEESKKFDEVVGDPTYEPIIESMRTQLIRLVRKFMERGLLKPEDFGMPPTPLPEKPKPTKKKKKATKRERKISTPMAMEMVEKSKITLSELPKAKKELKRAVDIVYRSLCWERAMEYVEKCEDPIPKGITTISALWLSEHPQYNTVETLRTLRDKATYIGGDWIAFYEGAKSKAIKIPEAGDSLMEYVSERLGFTPKDSQEALEIFEKYEL